MPPELIWFKYVETHTNQNLTHTHMQKTRRTPPFSAAVGQSDVITLNQVVFRKGGQRLRIQMTYHESKTDDVYVVYFSPNIKHHQTSSLISRLRLQLSGPSAVRSAGVVCTPSSLAGRSSFSEDSAHELYSQQLFFLRRLWHIPYFGIFLNYSELMYWNNDAAIINLVSSHGPTQTLKVLKLHKHQSDALVGEAACVFF